MFVRVCGAGLAAAQPLGIIFDVLMTRRLGVVY